MNKVNISKYKEHKPEIYDAWKKIWIGIPKNLWP